MKTPRRIVVTGRGPELAGTRFTAHDVAPMWRKGRIPAYISAVLGLSMDETEVLIRYIDEHKEEMLRHDDEIKRRITQGNPPEVEAKLRAIRGTARARQDELRKQRQEANGEVRTRPDSASAAVRRPAPARTRSAPSSSSPGPG
jgi:hypothetical protein